MPSFMSAYYRWNKEVGKYGALAGRAHVAWHKIEKVCQQYHPTILRTLRPGACEEDLDEVEKKLNHPLPEAFRLLYRFHDGQNIDGSMHPLHGLFGWITVHDYLRCTAMLPTVLVAKVPKCYGDRAMAYFGDDTAHSCNGPIERFLYSMHPLHKPSGGGILEWFEAYADALDSGYYKVAHFPDDTRARHSIEGISLIPRRPPGQVSMVTWVVRVSVSVIYLPVDKLPRHGLYNFASRIRFELLLEDEQREAWLPMAGLFRPLVPLQLRSCHWVNRNAAGQVEYVVDTNVAWEGFHLTSSEPSFDLRNFIDEHKPGGFWEGHFRFVEGSLAQPHGREIDVQCPRFRLCMPEYIF